MLRLGNAPRNYAERREDEEIFNQLVRDQRLQEAYDFLRDMPKRMGNHINAVRLRRRLGQQVWDECYSFSIERHPYSFVASLLNFSARQYNAGEKQVASGHDLSALLQNLIDTDGLKDLSNAKQYRNKQGKIIVNRIIRYENLQEELPEVLADIGLDPNLTLKLPSFKSLRRFTLDDARALFSDAQLEAIYTSQRATFEQFDYEH